MKKSIQILKFLPFYLLSVLPMWLLYRISNMFYIALYYGMGYRKKTVFGNLRNAFPEKDAAEIRNTAKRFYRHFCDVFVESIKRLTIRPEDARRRLTLKNPDLIRHYLAKERNILFYSAHQGNWEWLVFLPLFFPCDSNTVYQPLKNRYFNELVLVMRQRFGVHCIESKKAYRTILANDNGDKSQMFCAIGDQSPTRRSAKHWSRFLNRDTAFHLGADRFAKMADQVVIFTMFKKIKRGYYELEFKLIEEEPSKLIDFSVIDTYAALLEGSIASAPEMWLWSHKRWKLSPA